MFQAKHYQSTILKLTKQIDEYDVTNGELKEEVETLEVSIGFYGSFLIHTPFTAIKYFIRN